MSEIDIDIEVELADDKSVETEIPVLEHGIPSGGNRGEALVKNSDDDFDVVWKKVEGGGGGSGGVTEDDVIYLINKRTSNLQEKKAGGLDTKSKEVVGAINEVQQIANDADAAANLAKQTALGIAGTAESALSYANSAFSAANEAKSTSSDALTVAQGAAGRVETAVSVASSAATTANEAKEIATRAQSSLDSVQATSEEAKTKSEQAEAKATNAFSNSATALETAQSALSVAGSVSETASSALTTATNAFSAASEALDKAETAGQLTENAVQKTTKANQLYGTDENGNQTSYSTDSVGTKVMVDGQKVEEFNADEKFNISGGTISGDVSVQGNLNVTGTTTTTNTETLQVKDNVIVANSEGATLVEDSGFAIKTSTSTAYGIMYSPVGDGVKIGLGSFDENGKFIFADNQAQFLATRADTIADGNLPKWNNATKQFEDSGEKITDYTKTTDIPSIVKEAVPAWAQTEDKPTYTASEVGALPINTPIVENIGSSVAEETNVLTIELKDKDGNEIASTEVTLPGGSGGADLTEVEAVNARQQLELDGKIVTARFMITADDITNGTNTVTLQKRTGMTEIDWGDGTVNSELSHTYKDSGTYECKIYGVTYIDASTFENCESLTSVVIGDGITTIGRDAFLSCDSLASVFIPNSVDTIEIEAFAYCYDLTIYADFESEPSNWDDLWNPEQRPVFWRGYLKGDGAPSLTTISPYIGALYLDATNGATYQCTAIDTETPKYTWVKLIRETDIATSSQGSSAVNGNLGLTRYKGPTYGGLSIDENGCVTLFAQNNPKADRRKGVETNAVTTAYFNDFLIEAFTGDTHRLVLTDEQKSQAQNLLGAKKWYKHKITVGYQAGDDSVEDATSILQAILPFADKLSSPYALFGTGYEYAFLGQVLTNASQGGENAIIIANNFGNGFAVISANTTNKSINYVTPSSWLYAEEPTEI